METRYEIMPSRPEETVRVVVDWTNKEITVEYWKDNKVVFAHRPKEMFPIPGGTSIAGR